VHRATAIWTGFVLLVSLNLLDTGLTSILVTTPAGEANPLWAWAMGQVGVLPALVGTKGVLLVLLGLGLAYPVSLRFPWPRILAGANAVYVCVVAYSVTLLCL
jgi:hypothetical protein